MASRVHTVHQQGLPAEHPPVDPALDLRPGAKAIYPMMQAQKTALAEAEALLDGEPLRQHELDAFNAEIAQRKRLIQMYPTQAQEILERPYPPHIQKLVERAKALEAQRRAELAAMPQGGAGPQLPPAGGAPASPAPGAPPPPGGVVR